MYGVGKVKLQTKWSGRKSYRNEFMVLHLECMIVSGIENCILNQANLIKWNKTINYHHDIFKVPGEKNPKRKQLYWLLLESM